MVSACKEHEGFNSCTQSKMEEYDLLPYDGQEIDCDHILDLYVLNNQQYFHLYNPCLYVLTYPVDCEGNLACGKEGQVSCDTFYELAEYQGTIGYREYP